MTNEQLVNEIQQGINRVNNLEALYKQNIKFIRLIIFKTLKRSNIPDFILDDLMQVGYLALEKAATNYKVNKGYKFISYLSKCVRGYILRYGCPSTGFYDNSVSLDELLAVDEDLTLKDTIKDDKIIPFEEVTESNYLKIKLWEICKEKLTERENISIIKRFKYEKSLKTIAIEEDTTLQKVRSYVDSGLRKLRKNKNIRTIGEDWGYIYFRNVGIAEFNRTWTSSVEWAVFKGLDDDEKLYLGKC